MLRKTLLALAAGAMLGGTALIPTTASAHGFHGFGHHGHVFGWGHRAWIGTVYVDDACYYTRRGVLVCPGY